MCSAGLHGLDYQDQSCDLCSKVELREDSRTKGPNGDEDPEYRIAYDVSQRKVGCVLIQAALGGTVPSDMFHDFFSVDAWTVNAVGCQVYPIRRSQLPLLAARTNVDR